MQLVIACDNVKCISSGNVINDYVIANYVIGRRTILQYLSAKKQARS